MKINNCSILSSYIEQQLKEIGILNGCGGEGGFSFTKFFLDNIATIETFIPEKGNKLILDINRLCNTHDLLFCIPGTKIQFYFANYIFARDARKLLRWTGFFRSIGISITIFILLNRYGKKYFTFLK